MNISNDAPPAIDSDVNNQDTNSPDTEKNDQPSPFSKVLAKKQAVPEDDKRTKGESDFNTLLAGIMGGPTPLDRSVETSKAESKHVVPLPPDLQNLVSEISIASGGREVHIEMNSSALKNLHIRIEKQDGAVAIQFQSSSEETVRLLSRNIDSLSQTLADRGVKVADIKVTAAQENKKWPQKPGSKSDSQSGKGSQSGRQRQR